MPITQKVEVQVRYCEDCAYFQRDTGGSDKCNHPLVNTDNLVRRKGAEASCSVARRDYNAATTCGPTGRYWSKTERVSVPVAIRRTSFLDRLKELFA
jgi:hypothetical protein